MVSAQFCAELGDGVTTVALPLYVYARTGSPLATSLTFMAELLAGVLLGIVGGVVADGLDRRGVLLASYVARGALLVVAVAIGPLWLAITFGVLARAGGQLDNPSFDAMVPEHAEDDLQQVLALRRFIQAISYTIGPAIGALAVTIGGPHRALLLGTVAFALAFVLLAPMRGLDGSIGERRRANEGQALGDRLGSMLAGIGLLMGTPVVRRLIGYWSVVMTAIAIVMAAALVWFEETLGVAGAWYGISIAAYGVGSTLGLAWAGGRSFRLPLAVILMISAPLYAASSVLGIVAETPWLLPIGWLVWGIAMGPELVLGELLVVRSVPDALRGRAFAAMGVLMTLGAAGGYGLAGLLIEWLGPRVTIACTSAAILSLGLLWIGPARDPASPIMAPLADDDDEEAPAAGSVSSHQRPPAVPIAAD